MSEPDYQTASDQIIEIQTPQTRTKFHDPDDRVDFEREKYEDAKLERKAQVIRAILPNPRCR